MMSTAHHAVAHHRLSAHLGDGVRAGRDRPHVRLQRREQHPEHDLRARGGRNPLVALHPHVHGAAGEQGRRRGVEFHEPRVQSRPSVPGCARPRSARSSPDRSSGRRRFSMSPAQASPVVREPRRSSSGSSRSRSSLYGAGSVISGLLNSRRQLLLARARPGVQQRGRYRRDVRVRRARRQGDRRCAHLRSGPCCPCPRHHARRPRDVRRAGPRSAQDRVALLGRARAEGPRRARMLVLAVPTVIYVITNLVAVSFRNASALRRVGRRPFQSSCTRGRSSSSPTASSPSLWPPPCSRSCLTRPGATTATRFKRRSRRVCAHRRADASAIRAADRPRRCRSSRCTASASSRPRTSRRRRCALRWWAVGLIFFALHDVRAAHLLLDEGHAHADVRQPRADARRPDRALRGALDRHRLVGRHRASTECPLADVIFYAAASRRRSRCCCAAASAATTCAGVPATFGTMALASARAAALWRGDRRLIDLGIAASRGRGPRQDRRGGAARVSWSCSSLARLFGVAEARLGSRARRCARWPARRQRGRTG